MYYFTSSHFEISNCIYASSIVNKAWDRLKIFLSLFSHGLPPLCL